MPVESEIAQIKATILDHNKSNTAEFSQLNEKIDQNHDVHIRNEEVLKQILVQATKTNGRVTKNEDFINEQKVSNAQMKEMLEELKKQTITLFNISSKQDGLMTLKWKEMEERNEKLFEKKDEIKLVKNGFYTVCGIILLAVVGVWVSATIKGGSDLLTITKVL